jgi:hypothetical protein
MQMRASFGAIISDYFLAALSSTFDCAEKSKNQHRPAYNLMFGLGILSLKMATAIP